MPGFSKFFKEMAEEEHEHAQKVRIYYHAQCNRVSSREPSVCGVRCVAFVLCCAGLLYYVMLLFAASYRVTYILLCCVVSFSVCCIE